MNGGKVTHFGTLYRDLKQMQMRDGVNDATKLAFADQIGMRRQRNGKTLQNVLYLNSAKVQAQFQPSGSSPQNERTAGQRIWNAIKEQYGEQTANRIFQNVLADRSTHHRVTVSLADLDRIHDALEKTESAGTDFSHLYTHFKEHQAATGASDDRHLRFQDQKTFSDGKTATKVLYLHHRGTSSWNPFKRKQRSEKQQAAGPHIWKSIEREHGKVIADQVFRNVFGRKLTGHEQDHRVKITLGDLDQLSTAIKDELSRSETLKFDDFHDRLRQSNASGDTLLRYNQHAGLHLYTQGSEPSIGQNSLIDDQRHAARVKVWQALRNEFGESGANAIFQNALRSTNLQGVINMTDLDNIKQAVDRHRAAPLKKAAQAAAKLEATAKLESQKQIPRGTAVQDFETFVSDHRDVLLSGFLKTQDGGMVGETIRAALAFDLYDRMNQKGFNDADLANFMADSAAFCKAIDADPRQMPTGDPEATKQWMADRILERFFTKPSGSLTGNDGKFQLNFNDNSRLPKIKKAFDQKDTSDAKITYLRSEFRGMLRAQSDIADAAPGIHKALLQMNNPNVDRNSPKFDDFYDQKARDAMKGVQMEIRTTNAGRLVDTFKPGTENFNQLAKTLNFAPPQPDSQEYRQLQERFDALRESAQNAVKHPDPNEQDYDKYFDLNSDWVQQQVAILIKKQQGCYRTELAAHAERLKEQYQPDQPAFQVLLRNHGIDPDKMTKKDQQYIADRLSEIAYSHAMHEIPVDDAWIAKQGKKLINEVQKEQNFQGGSSIHVLHREATEATNQAMNALCDPQASADSRVAALLDADRAVRAYTDRSKAGTGSPAGDDDYKEALSAFFDQSLRGREQIQATHHHLNGPQGVALPLLFAIHLAKADPRLQALNDEMAGDIALNRLDGALSAASTSVANRVGQPDLKPEFAHVQQQATQLVDDLMKSNQGRPLDLAKHPISPQALNKAGIDQAKQQQVQNYLPKILQQVEPLAKEIKAQVEKQFEASDDLNASLVSTVSLVEQDS